MRTLLRSLALLLVISLYVGARAEDLPLGGGDGVLLLRNGELIEGHVSSSGDGYDVVLADGEIRIRAADVDLFCRDVRECYDRQHQAIEADKPEQHLTLAEWCLRHRLLKEAASEIGDAMALEPKHPKIGLLERRLKLLLEENAVATDSTNPPAQRVFTKQLDTMVRGMPPGSMEMFTHSVQPLLLNHCSTAGCHGPQSASSFRLLRAPAGRTGSRRSTQRNLHAVLAMVNRDAPETSPLLAVPLKPHGAAKAAIFTDREAAQYKQIVLWVYQIANYREPSAPAKLAEPAGPLLQTVSATESTPDSAGLPHEFGLPGSVATAQSGSAKAGQRPARTAPQRGAVTEKYVPRDEFDPELFNRGLID